jgi:hypothetical protein
MTVVRRDMPISTEVLATQQANATVQLEVAEPLPRLLLTLARSLINEGRFSVAVVVVHMACEIATEQSLSDAFATRAVQYLEDWVRGRLNGYNLAQRPGSKPLHCIDWGQSAEGDFLDEV